jgi:hypothetical protein
VSEAKQDFILVQRESSRFKRSHNIRDISHQDSVPTTTTTTTQQQQQQQYNNSTYSWLVGVYILLVVEFS